VALFFAFGALLAWRGTLETATYILVTGVIGSVASVIGLIALSTPRLTTKDLRGVETELFNTVAEHLKAAKDSEEKLATNKEELSKLQRERSEIELLVRQASLKVFYEERLRNIAAELENRLTRDEMLTRLFDEYNEVLERVQELNATISQSPRADLINAILGDVRKNETEKHRELNVRFMGVEIDIYPAIKASEKMISSLARIISP
jgi:vacuolar-type H+-ATPase subunit I/STV1